MAILPVIPPEALTQVEDMFGALTKFAKDAQAGLDAGVFPSVSDIATKFDTSQLNTYANAMKNMPANFMTGSAVETVHLAAAVMREYGMRVKGKADYYLDNASHTAQESDYYDSLKSMHTGALNGVYSTGSLA
jgi:hypothetical protein